MTNKILPIELYSVEQVRQAELDASQATENGLYQLVEKAGAAAFQWLQQYKPEAKKIAVLVGSGNNGADGLVLARWLAEHEYQVAVMGLLRPVNSKEYGQALQTLQTVNISIQAIELDELDKADVIVDALFGTGLSRPLSEEFQTLIKRINQSSAFRLSLDAPSGVNADSGFGELAVAADATLVFGALKRGLFTYQARHFCGEVFFADIGLQEFLAGSDTLRFDCSDIKGKLGKRARHAHKGDFGRVSVVGGDIGMPGAVRLCAEACFRAGSGLVAVVSRPEHQHIVVTACPELMYCSAEFIDMDVYHRLGWADVLVLGPGLGRQDWGQNLFKATILSGKPSVIDADALNILSKEPMQQENWVLTPHSGEAARLLDCSVEKVEADRFSAVKQLQQKYGGVAVLKGAGTLICDGNQTIVATVGNPGLSSGGCGDVLSGIIGALMAQGLSPMKAAYTGVIVHGCAADKAAEKGERGMIASDLMAPIREVVNSIE
ncbi:NAD(P)H-hydrate dehydratase [Parashewanella curva]|uniref:Bifunctional NAD(P)H-hydrate repair enzyme n=1 Tax=Parashewanella curva TaxID=2338552 RepID=A0A3L8Q189_9GAMM|nr:NAD(P)H-hydrate dehydratase [Parashewanella curva]RLV61355.1 NAD(P)H-hydrate dehydratase [Parashewanella curva]